MMPPDTAPRRGRASSPFRMQDVAKAAGVSISTVSRALRGAEGVGDDLRQKITALAKQSGYVLASGDRKVFTVVPFDLLSDDPAGFYGEILEAIEQELGRVGVAHEIVFLRSGEDDARQILEAARQHASSGLLMIGVDDRAALLQLTERIPTVLVNSDDPEMGVDTVSPNYRYGARLATRLLVDRGCRRIGHVTWLRRSTFFERLAGYRLALEAEGMVFEPSLIVEADHMTPDLARSAIESALDQGKLDGLDGLFCGNDLAAIGAIEALTSRGRRVPEDVAIVGFDNTRMTARFRPGLTTIAVDLGALGRLAVRQLLGRLDGDGGHPVEICLGVSIVRRETA